MAKVPGPPPQPAQAFSRIDAAGERVLVWSLCARSAQRWQQRLSFLGIDSDGAVGRLEALHKALLRTPPPRDGERSAEHPAALPAVMVDLGPDVSTVWPLLEEARPLLRPCPLVAVVHQRTWQAAAPWLLYGVGALAFDSGTDHDLLRALAAVRSDTFSLRHELLSGMMGDADSSRPDPAPTAPFQPPHFSPREREVLSLLCQGMSNVEIGRCLFVTREDVRHHLKSLYRKLGTSSRVQVATICLRNGWFSSEGK